MNGKSIITFVFMPFFLLMAMAGCDCGDDSDDGGDEDAAANDDSTADDDAVDDDVFDDDDAIDDDISDDDSTTDDDIFDDDSTTDDDSAADDDLTDDDLTDDDTGDDDTGDDDTSDDDATPEFSIEVVAGGSPGYDGLDFQFASQSWAVVVATKARQLIVYREQMKGWEAEIVSRHPSFEPSLAVDAADGLHIAFRDYTAGGLTYATNAGGSWSFSTIVEGAGRCPSLALDSNEKVHLSYYDETAGDLKYMTNASGEWEAAPVDAEGDAGWYSRLVLDSNDAAYIAYYVSDWYDVRYATNSSGTWQVEWVAPAGIGTHPGIALNSADVPYIISEAAGAVDIYARISGVWESIYFNASSPDENLDIAIDGAGWIHAIHGRSLSPDGLWYITNEGGSFTTHAIDPTTGTGHFVNLAIGAYGRPYVAYHNEYSGGLHFARRGADLDAWYRDTIDETPIAGLASAIRVDGQGRERIGYTGYGGSDLQVRYAERNDRAWNDELIEISDDRETMVALDLDGQEKPHVAYAKHLEYRYALDYAQKIAGAWHTTQIADYVEDETSINVAHDGADTVHLTYITGGGLNHAWREGADDWVSEIFMVPEEGANFVSMALDAAGAPRFSYVLWRYIYYLTWRPSVHFVWYDGTQYQDETAFTAYDAAYYYPYYFYARLALDSDGRPHFGVTHATGVSHVYQEDGNWITEQVVAAPQPEYAAIAVGENDAVHLAFYRWDTADLIYATNVSGAWELHALDTAGDVGSHPSITVADDMVYVTYYGDGALWLAKFPVDYF